MPTRWQTARTARDTTRALAALLARTTLTSAACGSDSSISVYIPRTPSPAEPADADCDGAAGDRHRGGHPDHGAAHDDQSAGRHRHGDHSTDAHVHQATHIHGRRGHGDGVDDGDTAGSDQDRDRTGDRDSDVAAAVGHRDGADARASVGHRDGDGDAEVDRPRHATRKREAATPCA